MEKKKVPIIKLDSFSYIYPDTEELVLTDINLEIEKGEFVGIIGRNKAGKSTLCTALVGLIPFLLGGQWSGNLYIDGVEIDDANVNCVSNTVGIVFQDAESQFSQETVEDEIAFTMCNMGIPQPEMVKRVEEVCISCNLKGLLKRSPYELSGGQQQRLAVACMLALKPEVIIFDETTSQLDPIGRQEIFFLAKNLHRAGFTIIMVDHNIELLAEYTTKLLVLNDSRIILYDDTRRVLQQKELLNHNSIRLPQVTEAAYRLRREYEILKLPVTLREAEGCFPGREKVSNSERLVNQ